MAYPVGSATDATDAETAVPAQERGPRHDAGGRLLDYSYLGTQEDYEQVAGTVRGRGMAA